MNEDNTEDLGEFEKLFFEQETPEKEPEAKEQDDEDVEGEDEDLGDNPSATEEDEDDVEDEEPQPKRKKHNFQERINELTAKAREAERREAEALKRLKELEASKTEKNAENEDAPALRDQLPPEAPHPDAVDKDGNPVYPLGEFDPLYIRDLTKFTITEEARAAKEAAQREAEQAQMEAVQQELVNHWIDKLDEAEAEIPTIREDIRTLTETFEHIDPSYGDYLASAVMMSDVGPQIMHYLSQNVSEARQIVASGPAAATLALGRLEARLSRSGDTEKKSNKKVSEAPNPPELNTRGRGGQFTVRPDTDDLDAFEREFYKKK